MNTPPASPRSSTGSSSLASSLASMALSAGSSYLRALHSYRPEPLSAGCGDRAACLHLHANAVIYVHSVHTSGWADGTLLTGERGWFPSNYCEPYVPEILQPLLEAKMVLEDILSARRFEEYTAAVATIISHVRQLLIEANCLTRESSLVEQHDIVRRDRKLMLSELSGLVHFTRRQALDSTEAVSELLLRIEYVVIRATKFVHTVGPLSGIYAAEVRKANTTIEMTPTPPISYDFSTPTIIEEDEETDRLRTNQANTDATSAASQLEAAHEILLLHLGAFIGHLQSQAQTQSVTQILLATRPCVNAARTLLACFEVITAHHQDQTLATGKDLLYTDITKLVTRGREVVGIEGGIVFETQTLIEAATSVLRGAGQCTLRARYLLEVHGDFEAGCGDEDDESLSGLPRHDTSSSLASIVDHRQSRDVQAQVELLSIKYKKVAPLEPIKATSRDAESLQSAARESTDKSHIEPPSPADSNMSDLPAVIYSESDLEETCNQDGQLIGATLTSLVQRLTPHDQMPDPQFTSTFYLTFRLFATPVQFAEMLISRFLWTLSAAGRSEGWKTSEAIPVRLRVFNVFKGWLESHWRAEQDSVALPLIERFAQGMLAESLPQAGKRLACIVASITSISNPKMVSLVGKTSTASGPNCPADAPVPAPVITRASLAALRTSSTANPLEDTSCCIIDFDDLEVARQFTLIESKMFCAISSVELVGQEFAKKAGMSLATNIKAMSAASTDIAGWVADSILWETEQKRRTCVLKHWIKIAERCAQLNNYNTLMAIMCALNSSTIARLKRTWDGLNRAQRAALDHLRSITDHQRNYAVYRTRIREATLPCLPYLGLYRTDLTFVDEGNPDHRNSKTTDRPLINFDKYCKTAKIISDLQHFQTPYRLQEVPELSAWIMAQCLRMRKSSTDLSGNLWRRSLVIEPKLPTTMRREPSVASSVDSDSWSNKLSFLSR